MRHPTSPYGGRPLNYLQATAHRSKKHRDLQISLNLVSVLAKSLGLRLCSRQGGVVVNCKNRVCSQRQIVSRRRVAKPPVGCELVLQINSHLHMISMINSSTINNIIITLQIA